MSISDGSSDRSTVNGIGSGRVALGHKLLYGVAYLPVALATILSMTWIMMRYHPPASATASVTLVTGFAFGAAIILGRVVDAVADPLIGYWSDRVRSRWGRRKPFILVGGPLLAMAFLLLWTPPVQTGVATINAAYLGFAASFFFFAFTIVVCPYLAMLPEMTADPAERVSLGAWQGGFNVAGVVGGMILTGYLVTEYGYTTMALLYMPIIVLCAWAPLLVPTPVAAAEPSKMRLRQAISSTFGNAWFVPYVLSQLLFWLALGIVMAVALQLPVVRAGADEMRASLPLAGALLVAGLLFPAMRTLSVRFGKRRILLWAMLWMAVVMVPLAFAGSLPVPLDPLLQILLVMVLAGPSVAALFALPNPIVGDIVDYDQTLTGERREAIYFGVQGLLTKIGMGVGAALAAILLDLLGDDLTHQGGLVAAPLLSMVMALAAAFVFRRYPGE